MMGDTERLIKMAQSENVLCVAEFNDYTLFNFVDEYCFKEWKYRSRYLNVEDFLYALDYMVLVEDAKFNIEAHLTLIELIYNFWNLANNKFEDILSFICDERWEGIYSSFRKFSRRVSGLG